MKPTGSAGRRSSLMTAGGSAANSGRNWNSSARFRKKTRKSTLREGQSIR